MSKNIYFNPLSNDIEIENFNLRLTAEKENIAQGIECRLKFFSGEWFLNRGIGVPYFQTVLKKNANTNVINAIFRDTILSAPGVKEITSYSANYKEDTRTYAISVTVNGDVNIDLEV